jgi:hypothetical protein
MDIKDKRCAEKTEKCKRAQTQVDAKAQKELTHKLKAQEE